MRLDHLATSLRAELLGDPAVDISSCATLEDARPGQLSFLANPKYLAHLETTHASAVLVSPAISSSHTSLLRIADPYYAFSQAVILLHGHRKHPFSGIHPLAHVDPTATIG